MNKLKLLNRIKELYQNSDINIIEYLKKMDNEEYNTNEDVMISYDFQAGTYVSAYKSDCFMKNEYCLSLAKVFDGVMDDSLIKSMVEVGVGEATTLGPVLKRMNNIPNNIYGFDISYSRIKYANLFLEELNLDNVNLFMGDLFQIPLKDNSIDLVYTSHSIEPNGGREKEALEELYRITNKYLILLEPAYELTSNEKIKQRMEKHGYITNIYKTAQQLGYNIIKYELFNISMNEMNPTGILIIKKEPKKEIMNPLCCPVTHTNINIYKKTYYSQKSLLAYPIIDNIPCLTPQNAIIATKFLD